MANAKKSCGVLLLDSAILLKKFPELIPKVLAYESPNEAFTKTLEEPPRKNIRGKTISDLAKAAQALRTIKRDFPKEIPTIERLFNLKID